MAEATLGPALLARQISSPRSTQTSHSPEGEPGVRSRGPGRTRTQGCRRPTLSLGLSEDDKRGVRARRPRLRLGHCERRSPGACGRLTPRRPASAAGCRSPGGAATGVHTLVAAHEGRAVSRVANDGLNSSALSRRAPRAVEPAQPRRRRCGSLNGMTREPCPVDVSRFWSCGVRRWCRGPQRLISTRRTQLLMSPALVATAMAPPSQ